SPSSLCCLFCLLCGSGPPPDLHSFPTRRSSDLSACCCGTAFSVISAFTGASCWASRRRPSRPATTSRSVHSAARKSPPACRKARSEEHTSELQSRFDLVCRLLLEKKKKHYTYMR